MGLMPWEKTTTCPYEPSHQITVGRIQTHLIKCRRNHPTTNHVICPYNASHHIPKPEEKFHMANCCDRKIVELAKYNWQLDNPGFHGNCDPPFGSSANRPQSKDPQDFMTDLEDWVSSGTRIDSYNPQKHCEKLDVLRRLQGATRSERKKFSAAEKIRHEELLSQKVSRQSILSQAEEDTGEFHSPRPTLFRKERPSVPLRRPTVTEDPRETLVRKERSSVEMDQVQKRGLKVEQQAASTSTTRNPRHGSITSRLLNMVGSKKQGSQIWETMESDISLNDTLDSTLGRLALTRKMEELRVKDPQVELRRPGGLGK